jgi:hypothetical protein
MRKNAIQVFWSKPYEKQASNSFGFKTLNHFYMSAYYSLQCLKKNGYTVKLVTDDYGKKILTEYFKIPYDRVDVSLNNITTTQYIWGLSKFYAYSLEKEPFLYVDLDFFMQKDIPSSMKKAEIFCQNIENNYLCYYYGYMGFNKFIDKKDTIYEHFESLLEKNKIGYSYNTAVFGGQNIELIHKASRAMFDFVEKNNLNDLILVEKSDRDLFSILSIFIEQVYLYYYLTLNNPEVEVIPLFKNDIRINFSEFRKWNDGYLHLISNLKKEHNEVLENLEKMSGTNGFFEVESSVIGIGYENLLKYTRLLY